MKGQSFCILCKDFAERRYEINVKDAGTNIGLRNHLCRECFQKFLQSHHNKGFFKLSKMITWVKERRDRMRWL